MTRRVFAASLAFATTRPMTPASNSSAAGFTSIPGVEVGHFTDTRRPTGCTAIVFRKGAVAGVDVRGAAPGTRDTELLNPVNTVQQIHAIMLSGGSAYGLETASGAMRYLEEQGIGFHLGNQIIPIVPAAILYDLPVGVSHGNEHVRPDAAAGYAACKAASNGPVAEGSIGAGAGATIGKYFGPRSMMKSGIGSAGMTIGNTGIIVAAIVAVNAVGDIRDPATGRIIAGARKPDGSGFIDTMARLREGHSATIESGSNTTIGVVATNAIFDKAQMTKIAQMAHDGLARAVNPVHTTMDGDTIFAASIGAAKAPMDHGVIGAIAAEVMTEAVLRAVKLATGLPGIPAYRDLR